MMSKTSTSFFVNSSRAFNARQLSLIDLSLTRVRMSIFDFFFYWVFSSNKLLGYSRIDDGLNPVLRSIYVPLVRQPLFGVLIRGGTIYIMYAAPVVNHTRDGNTRINISALSLDMHAEWKPLDRSLVPWQSISLPSNLSIPLLTLILLQMPMRCIEVLPRVKFSVRLYKCRHCTVHRTSVFPFPDPRHRFSRSRRTLRFSSDDIVPS